MAFEPMAVAEGVMGDVPVGHRETVFRELPSLRFAKQHRGKLTYLTKHLTAEGDLSEQQYRPTCACGWQGSSTTSLMVADGEHQDHIMSEWQKTLN
jgi:hypothetical protein